MPHRILAKLRLEPQRKTPVGSASRVAALACPASGGAGRLEGRRRKHEQMSTDFRPSRRLEDRIKPGVRILFVGINPGLRSAATGHHFAGYSNRFWKLLHQSGLVPEPISYQDDDRLPEWG